MDKYVYLDTNLRNKKIPDSDSIIPKSEEPKGIGGDRELLNISNIPQCLVGDYWKFTGKVQEELLKVRTIFEQKNCKDKQLVDGIQASFNEYDKKLTDLAEEINRLTNELSNNIKAAFMQLESRLNQVQQKAELNGVDNLFAQYNVDKEIKLFLDESQAADENIAGNVNCDSNSRQISYAIKVNHNRIDFRPIQRPWTQEELIKHKAFFRRIVNPNTGDVAYEVISKSPDFKMKKLIAKKVAKARGNFDKSRANSGKGQEIYFVLKFNDTQIQFKKKMNIEFERFSNPYFFICNEADKFQMYVCKNKQQGYYQKKKPFFKKEKKTWVKKQNPSGKNFNGMQRKPNSFKKFGQVNTLQGNQKYFSQLNTFKRENQGLRTELREIKSLLRKQAGGPSPYFYPALRW